jgi:hypothetical protein
VFTTGAIPQDVEGWCAQHADRFNSYFSTEAAAWEAVSKLLAEYGPYHIQVEIEDKMTTTTETPVPTIAQFKDDLDERWAFQAKVPDLGKIYTHFDPQSAAVPNMLEAVAQWAYTRRALATGQLHVMVFLKCGCTA